MLKVFTAIFLLLFTLNLKGSEILSEPFLGEGDSIVLNNEKIAKANKVIALLNQKKEHKKLTAVVLAVLLGPFGMHRLYLGTRPLVPVVYTLTLGGGLGLLPLTDIIAILTTKDLGKYSDNNKIIMWIKD